MTYPKLQSECEEHEYSTNGRIHCDFMDYDGKKRCNHCGVLEGLRFEPTPIPGPDDVEVVPKSNLEKLKPKAKVKDGKTIVRFVSCGVRHNGKKKITKYEKLDECSQLSNHWHMSFNSKTPLGNIAEFEFSEDVWDRAIVRSTSEWHEVKEDLDTWKIEERVALQTIKAEQVKKKYERQNKDLRDMTLREIKDKIKYDGQSKHHIVAYLADYFSN